MSISNAAARRQAFATARMSRLVRPETPEEAAAVQYDGTLFGFNWHNGVPHDAVQDDRHEGYESGEMHHYKEVPVSLETVNAAL